MTFGWAWCICLLGVGLFVGSASDCAWWFSVDFGFGELFGLLWLFGCWAMRMGLHVLSCFDDGLV